MGTHTGAPAPGLTPGDGGPIWHTLSADEVLGAEKVDEHSGLSSAEVASRAARFGPNKFDARTAAPRWRVFVRQYTDLMQIVLLVAGVVSLVVIATGVSILTLLLTTVFGPLQAFLKTTSLDVRQWLICLAVALSIVVLSEIQKAVRRHTAPGHEETR